MKMLYSFFLSEDGEMQRFNAKTIIIIVVAVIVVFGICFLTSNNIPADYKYQVNADEQPPAMRYEVKYGTHTFFLYDPMVENPNDPLGSIEERAIEVVKKEYGNTLPDGFEKNIKIAKIIN